MRFLIVVEGLVDVGRGGRFLFGPEGREVRSRGDKNRLLCSMAGGREEEEEEGGGERRKARETKRRRRTCNVNVAVDGDDDATELERLMDAGKRKQTEQN